VRAYKADPAFREAFLTEMRWHRDQDKFMHDTYSEGSNGDFRGCSVGCSIHSLARLQGRKLDPSNHSILATELDIPVELFHLQDALFESLPSDRAATWPIEFSEAAACNADLSQVHIHFMYWILTDANDGVIRNAGKFTEVKTAIEGVAALLIKELAGIHNNEEWSAAESATWSAAESAAESATWSAARSAAWSAARSAAWSAAESAAWSAAESAAWAARSAESAAESAAWAARSAAWSAAESAAWAARSAESAAWSARSAARVQQADKLLQLMRDAPMSSEAPHIGK
jgi:hypothetical protein